MSLIAKRLTRKNNHTYQQLFKIICFLCLVEVWFLHFSWKDCLASSCEKDLNKTATVSAVDEYSQRRAPVERAAILKMLISNFECR